MEKRKTKQKCFLILEFFWGIYDYEIIMLDSRMDNDGFCPLYNIKLVILKHSRNQGLMYLRGASRQWDHLYWVKEVYFVVFLL